MFPKEEMDILALDSHLQMGKYSHILATYMWKYA